MWKLASILFFVTLGLQACSSKSQDFNASMDVSDAEASLIIGNYYAFSLGKPAQAYKYFEEAIRLKPDSNSNLSQIAQFLAGQARYATCVEKDASQSQNWVRRLKNTSKDKHLISLTDNCAFMTHEQSRHQFYLKESAKAYDASGDYFWKIERDPHTAISHYEKLMNIIPLYGSRKLAELYLSLPLTKKSRIRVKELLLINQKFDNESCADTDLSKQCANKFYDIYLSYLYLSPNTVTTDLEAGEKILLLQAKRGADWAKSELIYFYNCQKPDQHKFNYWFNQRFPNKTQEGYMPICVIDPIKAGLDRYALL